MKPGDQYVIERCATGYVITRNGLPSGGFLCLEGRKLSAEIHAFSHKEQVLSFLRKALTLDCQKGIAKEINEHRNRS